eukprot:6467959-Amphidinium_carterae.1
MSAEEHKSRDEILRAAKSKQAARPATKPTSDKREHRYHDEDGDPPDDQWAMWRAKHGMSSVPPKKQETPKKTGKSEEPDGQGSHDGNDDDDERKKKKKSRRRKSPSPPS